MDWKWQGLTPIEVTESGSYVLTIQGACQNWVSQPVDITVVADEAPVVPNSTILIPVPQVVTLTATGNNLTWYDAPTGGNVVGTGNSFVTPEIQIPTYYYVEGVDTAFGGVVS